MADRAELTARSVNDRGFKHMPPIAGEYGGEVKVYESSAARSPHVWINVAHDQDIGATLHLTAENAWLLAEQLRSLVRNHYQGDATPQEDR